MKNNKITINKKNSNKTVLKAGALLELVILYGMVALLTKVIYPLYLVYSYEPQQIEGNLKIVIDQGTLLLLEATIRPSGGLQKEVVHTLTALMDVYPLSPQEQITALRIIVKNLMEIHNSNLITDSETLDKLNLMMFEINRIYAHPTHGTMQENMAKMIITHNIANPS